MLYSVCPDGEQHKMSRRKSGSYIGGHTIVGPHTGWFSGVSRSKKRAAKKAESKSKKSKGRLARIIEQAEAEEEFRRQRRELTQARLKSHKQSVDQPASSDSRANARMSRVTVVRKKRARPVLHLRSDKVETGK